MIASRVAPATTNSGARTARTRFSVRGATDKLHGGLGSDLIDGGDGNDDLRGDAGSDKILGGAGNDLMIGGGSGDDMAGGTGDDFYSLDSTSDIVTELAGQGTDTISTQFFSIDLAKCGERFPRRDWATSI
jgi:Ca2+-binding RTX toxin-like protein